MAPSLLHLPEEVLVQVFAKVPISDLPGLRTLCSAVERASFKSFVKAFFTHRSHRTSGDDLSKLLDILSHEVLGANIRHITFTAGDASLEDTCNTRPTTKLQQALLKVAERGQRMSLGIDVRGWNEDQFDKPAFILYHIYAAIVRYKLLVDSLTIKLCDHIATRPIAFPPGPDVNVPTIEFRTLCNVSELLDNPRFANVKWVIDFPATTARFEYTPSTGLFYGKAFSLFHIGLIEHILDGMHIVEVAFSYADCTRDFVGNVLSLNRGTLKRISLHSVSLFNQHGFGPDAEILDEDWDLLVCYMSLFKLEHCSLEYLWDGGLAAIASEYITEEE